MYLSEALKRELFFLGGFEVCKMASASSYNCRRSLDQSKKSGIPFQDAFWPPLGCSKSLGTSHISLPLTTRFSR